MKIRRGSDPAVRAAEPVVEDEMPKRRSSVARPGSGNLVGLEPENPKGVYDDDESTRPESPEMFKQTSEMELLGTASSSLGPVSKFIDNRRR